MFPAIAALLIQRHLIDFNDFLILVYILIIPVIICFKIRSSDSVSCIHWGPVLAVESTNKTATMIKRRRDPFIHSFHHVTKVKLGRANTGPAYRFPLSFQSWILRSNLKRWKTNMWTNCKSGHLWSTYSTHPSISVTKNCKVSVRTPLCQWFAYILYISPHALLSGWKGSVLYMCFI